MRFHISFLATKYLLQSIDKACNPSIFGNMHQNSSMAILIIQYTERAAATL